MATFELRQNKLATGKSKNFSGHPDIYKLIKFIDKNKIRRKAKL
jgi:hypothetical protein